ncbi:unnamed protein product [Arabis nemorensis]|uniref:SP-RING-type domain-containing protein n=1 Tax=Arabis nemorensis TaxID=586526 RepID=A0A565AMC0_9BRAS|nr:unnamed protein product [Arabis nemorensis]
MVIPPISRLGFRSEVDNKDEYEASCKSMANEIDELIGKNQVPVHAEEFALIILDHMRRLRCDDAKTKAAVMVLMISANLWNGFSSAESVIPSVNSHLTLFQQVIERFYPFVKLGHIIVSFEAKQESKTLVKDFYISENMPHSPKPKIGLFVVRTEDISKSSCIMHPQEVSFLLNGKSVEKRVNISMDSGPQLPTNVTNLVYPGANLLQAIGCFRDRYPFAIGSYFIVIAFAEVMLLPDKPLLKDYVHSEVTESNSDCDIMEGPSRISLSCPISRTRIKLPVKGHSCKHLQILEEVGSNASDVVISADGSWRVVTENNENVDLVPETTHEHGDPKSLLTSGPTVMDLTRDEDEMDTSGCTQVDEQKPCLSEIRGLSDNTYKTATDYTMLNQSPASVNALPQLPQTFNVFSGQQFMNRPHIVNTRDSAARQSIPMPFLPTSSPQDRLATSTASLHTSMPAAQSSQFQGSHQCLGRTSDLMERWNHIYGNGINQTQFPPIPPLHHHYAMQNQRPPNRSLSPAQQRPMLSSVTHPQTLAVNYGRATDQRPPTMEQFSSREFMNLASANTANWQSQTRMATNLQPQTRMATNWQPQTRMANTTNWQPQTRMANTANWQPQTQMANTENWQPQTRMRGSITPGSTVYDQRIILPTQPVNAQAQTLPPPQTTTYNNNMADEIQAFLAHPSYSNSNNETQPGISSLPVAGGFGALGSFWSMPPETW